MPIPLVSLRMTDFPGLGPFPQGEDRFVYGEELPVPRLVGAVERGPVNEVREFSSVEEMYEAHGESLAMMARLPAGGPVTHAHVFYRDGVCGFYGCKVEGEPSLVEPPMTAWQHIMSPEG